MTSGLMVIGGHSGDEAAMAGAIVSRYARKGHQTYLVSMTQGERGHHTLSPAEYLKQKEAEGREAAAVLGAKPVFLPFRGRLGVTDETQNALAAVIEECSPEVIITHWRGSFHADHVATCSNTILALSQVEHKPKSSLFAENWEDLFDYRPEIYLPHDDEDEAIWLKACECFEFFREGFYNFRNTSAEYNATSASPLGFDTSSALRWTTQPALAPRRLSRCEAPYRNPRGPTIPNMAAKPTPDQVAICYARLRCYQLPLPPLLPVPPFRPRGGIRRWFVGYHSDETRDTSRSSRTIHSRLPIVRP